MIITLSPAKIMDFKTPVVGSESSKPLFVKQAGELIERLSQLEKEDIAHLMSVNPKQAFDAYQQIQSFNISKTPSKQAGYAYNGIAFQGLDIASLADGDIAYAQEHLLILSGLYGSVRPLDMIKPYRLEMQAKLQNSKGENLYKYWTDTLSDYLAKRMKADDRIWINLMSKEYTKVIDFKKLPSDVQVITPDFKEQTATGFRQVVVHTKKARGMLARFIIKNKITDVEYLKAFDYEGYSFSEQLSKKGNWVFVR